MSTAIEHRNQQPVETGARAWPILGVAALGAVASGGALVLMGRACASSEWGWLCEAVQQNNAPWLLISGLAAAPSVLLTWFWRHANKRRDQEQKAWELRIEQQKTDAATNAAAELAAERRLELHMRHQIRASEVAHDLIEKIEAAQRGRSLGKWLAKADGQLAKLVGEGVVSPILPFAFEDFRRQVGLMPHEASAAQQAEFAQYLLALLRQPISPLTWLNATLAYTETRVTATLLLANLSAHETRDRFRLSPPG